MDKEPISERFSRPLVTVVATVRCKPTEDHGTVDIAAMIRSADLTLELSFNSSDAGSWAAREYAWASTQAVVEIATTAGKITVDPQDKSETKVTNSWGGGAAIKLPHVGVSKTSDSKTERTLQTSAMSVRSNGTRQVFVDIYTFALARPGEYLEGMLTLPAEVVWPANRELELIVRVRPKYPALLANGRPQSDMMTSLAAIFAGRGAIQHIFDGVEFGVVITPLSKQAQDNV